jgi:peptidoglycan/xylan/chitin deacetylase (PgdA/CDA1 family)
MLINRIYYFLKPFIPRTLQLFLRRKLIRRKRLRYSYIWPIDENAAEAPEGWSGWPEKKQFALVLTHDVDTAKGHENSLILMTLEKELGFRSSFNFVPERYQVSPSIRNALSANGFEVGVHGLTHDGKLYSSKRIFKERSIKINRYLKQWNAVGFRSPAMHHNLDWIRDLNIKYDASTFDTDPFEPQSDSVHTIFPFWVKGNSGKKGYVELPYTLPQDSTLFVLMKEKGITIWKEKLDWIAKKGGMALLNVHPDYINFKNRNCSIEEYPIKFYKDFLEYVKIKYEDKYWHILPREMSCFWTKNIIEAHFGY